MVRDVTTDLRKLCRFVFELVFSTYLDDGKKTEKKHTGEEQGEEDKERKPCRKAYVHKPFLYSRYYSDSDDEVTVEERRRSVVGFCAAAVLMGV